jgi:hypothetical protein
MIHGEKRVDPDPTIALVPQEHTLASWLEVWLEGRSYQPALVQDETTGSSARRATRRFGRSWRS